MKKHLLAATLLSMAACGSHPAPPPAAPVAVAPTAPAAAPTPAPAPAAPAAPKPEYGAWGFDTVRHGHEGLARPQLLSTTRTAPG